MEVEGEGATEVYAIGEYQQEEGVVMTMHSPTHPGEILRERYLAPLDLSVTAVAEGLGVSRQTLSEFVNGHNGVSQDMAIRLGKAFPNTDIRYWLGLQLQYDAWQAEQRADTIEVARFPSPEKSGPVPKSP